jgi:hypothetical protein
MEEIHLETLHKVADTIPARLLNLNHDVYDRIPGEIGLTIKVGLYTSLRQQEIVHLHKTELKQMASCNSRRWLVDVVNNKALLHSYIRESELPLMSESIVCTK